MHQPADKPGPPQFQEEAEFRRKLRRFALLPVLGFGLATALLLTPLLLVPHDRVHWGFLVGAGVIAALSALWLRDFLRHATWLFRSVTEKVRAEDALRRSEERLRLALRATNDAVWDWDLVTNRVLWSQAVGKLFGYSLKEVEAGDRWWFTHMHSEDRDRIWNSIRAVIDGDGEQWQEKYRFVRADDSIASVFDRGHVIRDAAGKAIRMIGAMQDVTKEKEVAEALAAAKERAEVGLRAKDSFLAALSHELRTPLTPALMTTAALRQDEQLPEAVRAQLAMVQRNIELEARLIDDLLDLTHISRGKLPLRSEPCNVHTLIELAVGIVREETLSKTQTLEIELAATRTHLIADPSRLQQVFWNILRNAVKFTPSGGRIEIRTSDCGESIRIEFIDSGIGIQPEAVERIFSPFDQAGRENDHRFGGLGLGLSIARAIVDLHGGTITASSPGSGAGAKIEVMLPGVSAHSFRRKETPETAAGSATSAIRSLRLLVVEDHRQTLDVLQRLLVRAGHRVCVADSVASALAVAAANQFDGVVSDLGLPDGTGFDLMRELRDTYSLQGIALSGYGMEEDLRRSSESGFIAHLIKPVGMDQLRQALEKLPAC